MKAALALMTSLALLQTGPGGPSFEDAMQGIVAAVRRGELESGRDAALALHERADELDEYQRAEAGFALGLLAFLLEESAGTSVVGLAPSVAPFESARALAGPGALRLAASYDVALVHLETAERWRAHLPEVAQTETPPTQLPLPAPPQGAAPPAIPGLTGGQPTEDQGPDPLVEARGEYLVARERFIERLRADWRDADTRANLELIQRRLRELDEIEEQRRQEQERQDQEQQGDEQEQGDEQQEDEGDSQEEQEGEDGEEREPEEEDSRGDEEDSGENQEKQPQEQEQADPDQEGGEAESVQGEPEEQLMTREEMMRLLDRLADLEQDREALEALLRQSSRIPVERDW